MVSGSHALLTDGNFKAHKERTPSKTVPFEVLPLHCFSGIKMKHHASKIVCVFKLLRPNHSWWKKAVHSAFVRTTRGFGIGENWKLKEKMVLPIFIMH
jgi:hypothetical protein